MDFIKLKPYHKYLPYGLKIAFSPNLFYSIGYVKLKFIFYIKPESTYFSYKKNIIKCETVVQIQKLLCM